MARLVSSHWFVYFYKVYANTLYIFLFCIIRHVWYGNLLEVSAPLFRVLFFFYVSDVFRGGSEDVGEYFQSFPCNLDCLSCPISLRISALIYFSGLRSSNHLSGGAYFRLLVFPKFPVFLGGFRSSWKGLIRNCKRRPIKYSTWLLFYLSHGGEYFLVYIPWSITGLLWWPYFLFIL